MANIEEKIISEKELELVINLDLVGTNNRELEKILKDALKKGFEKIILNMEKVKFIDSSGLGMLVGMNSNFKKHKISLFCKNLSPDVEKIFKITRLDSIIKIIE